MRRDERGMALYELVIVIAIMGFVLTALLGMLDTAAKMGPRDQERAHAIREAQTGLHVMTRELRTAYKVLEATDYSMYVLLTINGVDKHVRYDCNRPYSATDDPNHPYDQSYMRCRRRIATVGQALPSDPDSGTVVIDRILAEQVFTYSPTALAPTYVEAKIKVPSRGERKEGNNHTVTLDDGFYMRNVDVG